MAEWRSCGNPGVERGPQGGPTSHTASPSCTRPERLANAGVGEVSVAICREIPWSSRGRGALGSGKPRGRGGGGVNDEAAGRHARRARAGWAVEERGSGAPSSRPSSLAQRSRIRLRFTPSSEPVSTSGAQGDVAGGSKHLLRCTTPTSPPSPAGDLQAGALSGYRLLWAVALVTFVGMLVQLETARVAVATGRGLAPLLRDRLGRRGVAALWATLEVAVVGADVQAVLGTALALRFLSGAALGHGGAAEDVAGGFGPPRLSAYAAVLLGGAVSLAGLVVGTVSLPNFARLPNWAQARARARTTATTEEPPLDEALLTPAEPDVPTSQIEADAAAQPAVRAAILGLVGGLGVVFVAIAPLAAGIDGRRFVRGLLVPTLSLAPGSPDVALVLAALGAVVMPHNPFLYSELVAAEEQGRRRCLAEAARQGRDVLAGDLEGGATGDLDAGTDASADADAGADADTHAHPERRTDLDRHARDTAVSVGLSLIVNLSVVGVFAAAAAADADADDADSWGLATAGPRLAARLGPVLGAVWGVGLAASGSAGAIAGTLAGQAILCGLLGVRLSTPHRALIVRAASIGPALLLAVACPPVEDASGGCVDVFLQGLNLAQAVALPPVLVALAGLAADVRVTGTDLAPHGGARYLSVGALATAAIASGLGALAAGASAAQSARVAGGDVLAAAAGLTVAAVAGGYGWLMWELWRRVTGPTGGGEGSGGGGRSGLLGDTFDGNDDVATAAMTPLLLAPSPPPPPGEEEEVREVGDAPSAVAATMSPALPPPLAEIPAGDFLCADHADDADIADAALCRASAVAATVTPPPPSSCLWPPRTRIVVVGGTPLLPTAEQPVDDDGGITESRRVSLSGRADKDRLESSTFARALVGDSRTHDITGLGDGGGSPSTTGSASGSFRPALPPQGSLPRVLSGPCRVVPALPPASDPAALGATVVHFTAGMTLGDMLRRSSLERSKASARAEERVESTPLPLAPDSDVALVAVEPAQSSSQAAAIPGSALARSGSLVLASRACPSLPSISEVIGVEEAGKVATGEPSPDGSIDPWVDEDGEGDRGNEGEPAAPCPLAQVGLGEGEGRLPARLVRATSVGLQAAPPSPQGPKPAGTDGSHGVGRLSLSSSLRKGSGVVITDPVRSDPAGRVRVVGVVPADGNAAVAAPTEQPPQRPPLAGTSDGSSVTGASAPLTSGPAPTSRAADDPSPYLLPFSVGSPSPRRGGRASTVESENPVGRLSTGSRVNGAGVAGGPPARALGAGRALQHPPNRSAVEVMLGEGGQEDHSKVRVGGGEGAAPSAPELPRSLSAAFLTPLPVDSPLEKGRGEREEGG